MNYQFKIEMCNQVIHTSDGTGIEYLQAYLQKKALEILIKVNDMIVSEEQKEALNELWFVYGNKGKKHTHCNHRFIQNILEQGKDTREFYLASPKNDLTLECVKAVDAIFVSKEKEIL